MPSSTKSRRAAPLSPPERRAAIIAATIPLLRSHGPSVTTRQIAAAADVAEGTIFSVFDDKESLIAAAVEAALDPAPAIEQLRAIEPGEPLEPRLVEAVGIVQDHLARTWQLLVAVGPDTRRRPPLRPSSTAVADQVAALEPIFHPAAADLRRSPSDAAQALLALTVGCSHPAIVASPVSPEQIVDLLLDGVRRSSP